VDRCDRVQAEAGRQDPVEGRRGAAALDVAEDRAAGLLAGPLLDLLGQHLADAAQPDVTAMAADTVVLATRNAAKLRELARILGAEDSASRDGGEQIRLAGLDEFPGAPDVPETGATFEENALLKARAIADYTGLPAVADDSGLCVDALNGMPGVLSARWAGRHGDDKANLELVLAQVTDVPSAIDRIHLSRAMISCPSLRMVSGLPMRLPAASTATATWTRLCGSIPTVTIKTSLRSIG